MNRWGHMQKKTRVTNLRTGQTHERIYRVKMQVRSLRYEAQAVEPPRQWLHIGGGYFKDCEELPDGRLKLGSVIFKAIST